jgi:hypothetical protein
METTLDHQIGVLRKHALEHEFVGRVATEGGLLASAFSVVAEVVEHWHYRGKGKMSMHELKGDMLGQLLGLIDSLAIDERIKVLLRQELPFGTAVVLNLIEVVPLIVKQSGVSTDPVQWVSSPLIIRAANQIGSCPGYIAPVIRREFTRYRDSSGIDWVRADGGGNERHDRYVAENFTLNTSGAIIMTGETYDRIERELNSRQKKVSYGGCPASRFLIGHDYGNLLNAMAHVVTRACIDYFDFRVSNDRLVRRDSTEQIFYHDPAPGNNDLYDNR